MWSSSTSRTNAADCDKSCVVESADDAVDSAVSEGRRFGCSLTIVAEAEVESEGAGPLRGVAGRSVGAAALTFTTVDTVIGAVAVSRGEGGRDEGRGCTTFGAAVVAAVAAIV